MIYQIFRGSLLFSLVFCAYIHSPKSGQSPYVQLRPSATGRADVHVTAMHCSRHGYPSVVQGLRCSASFASWHRGLSTHGVCTPGTAQQRCPAQCQGLHVRRTSYVKSCRIPRCHVWLHPQQSLFATRVNHVDTRRHFTRLACPFEFTWPVVMVEPRLVCVILWGCCRMHG